MAKKRYTPEQIIQKLQEAEVRLNDFVLIKKFLSNQDKNILNYLKISALRSESMIYPRLDLL
jgi:hypothetical protein